VKEPLLPGGAPRQAFFSFQPIVLPTPGLEKMSGREDNAMFLPKQEPIFENGGFPYSAAPPFRNMLSLLKSNDDIFPLPQTSPSASTPKTPPYTGYPVQTVSHIACPCTAFTPSDSLATANNSWILILTFAITSLQNSFPNFQ